jgi:hypothetical protein
MSKKKAKKVRQPNLPAAINVNVAAGQGGSPEAPAATVERKPSATVFDYTYVKKDLARIGVLAGSFIAVLIILSFFINR